MRIATYNIHHAQGVDGLISTRRIASVLAAVKADVIGLNEVLNLPRSLDQAGRVAARLGMSCSFAEAHHYWIVGTGNAVLTRGAIVDVDGIELPGGVERRHCLICTIELDHVRFRFATAHLSLSREARALSFRLIADKLPDDLPLILSGDFNAAPEELALLRSRWSLIDSPFTFPSWRPDRSIDLVAYSSGWTPTRALVVPSRASDHRPLVVDFDWPVGS